MSYKSSGCFAAISVASSFLDKNIMVKCKLFHEDKTLSDFLKSTSNLLKHLTEASDLCRKATKKQTGNAAKQVNLISHQQHRKCLRLKCLETDCRIHSGRDRRDGWVEEFDVFNQQLKKLWIEFEICQWISLKCLWKYMHWIRQIFFFF